ncbi:hypothetical protein OBBRIDRAFT_527153 [Obba rivulosa]|uniref:Uncharacterized protein n=1 Tax=Obba rivulosa TaxID=1052685 RepID=A0A8E2AUU3_9APHY|nr:hypothetical protein OBBRIDRAFT_527153 [Obba rivulosa]
MSSCFLRYSPPLSNGYHQTRTPPAYNLMEILPLQSSSVPSDTRSLSPYHPLALTVFRPLCAILLGLGVLPLLGGWLRVRLWPRKSPFVPVVARPGDTDNAARILSNVDGQLLDLSIRSAAAKPPRDFSAEEIVRITDWLYTYRGRIHSLTFVLGADLLNVFERKSTPFSAHQVIFPSGASLGNMEPFSNLTALSLTTGYSVPLAFVAPFLAKCPALEIFILEKLLSEEPRESENDLEVSSRTPTHLSKLTTMRLSKYGYGYATRLFEIISFPSTTCVSLFFEGRGRPPLRTCGTSLQPVLSRMQEAAIRYKKISDASVGTGPTFSIDISSRDKQFSLRWQFQTGSTEPASEWLDFNNLGMDVFELHRLRDLTMELHYAVFSVAHWKGLLSHMRDLRRLTVRFVGCHAASPRYLYQALQEHDSCDYFDLSVQLVTCTA